LVLRIETDGWLSLRTRKLDTGHLGRCFCLRNPQEEMKMERQIPDKVLNKPNRPRKAGFAACTDQSSQQSREPEVKAESIDPMKIDWEKKGSEPLF
jgi:hypothetical protein